MLKNEIVVTKTELVISNLLRTGVVLSLVTVLIGVILMFAHHHDYLRSSADLKRLTTPGAAFPASIAELARGLAAFQGRAVVSLGLLMLIATPIFRVAVSIIAFAIERDRTYVAITTVVLAVLLLAFFLGKAG
jgi:uncharacterized membrane protein